MDIVFVSNLEVLIIVTILFLTKALEDAFREKEERTPELHDDKGRLSSLWHLFGGINKLTIIYIAYRLTKDWQLIALISGILWVLYDGIINLIALNRDLFFIGNSAGLDKAITWLKRKTFIKKNWYYKVGYAILVSLIYLL